MSQIRARPSSDAAVLLIRRSIRRLIGALGWLLRPQWFVKNVAPALEEGCGPTAPPGVLVRLGSPDDGAALTPLIHGRESLAWRFARGDIVLVAELDGRVVGCT